MDRKPRGDSKLDRLPESRVMELRDGLLAGWTHDECLSWLFAECGGVTCAGSALTAFYKRHCVPLIKERRRLSSAKAELYVDEAGRTDWNEATMELVKQVTFEMLDGQRSDPEIAEKFVKLVLKKDAQDQSRTKAQAAAQSKIDAGLEAMFAEIKGNKKAEAIFAQLKEVVSKA